MSAVDYPEEWADYERRNAHARRAYELDPSAASSLIDAEDFVRTLPEELHRKWMGRVHRSSAIGPTALAGVMEQLGRRWAAVA